VDNTIPTTVGIAEPVVRQYRRGAVRGMDFNGQYFLVPADLQQLDSLRTAFGSFLQQVGYDDNDVNRWQLVLSEAVTNAITHGSGGDSSRQIKVSWLAGDTQVRLEVGDSGNGPDQKIQRAKLPDDPLQTGGRGLYLIEQSCDQIEQWRGPEGFKLAMWRERPKARPRTEVSTELLESALVEISQCYESLAAFYRLGDALATAERLRDFFARAIADIAKVVPHDHMTLHFSEALQPALRAELGTLPFAQQKIISEGVIERVLGEGREWIWEHNHEIAGDPDFNGFACGASLPLRAGGMTWGVITFTRKSQPYLIAAELGAVRTYADLFGIALANANNTLLRENEQQALREMDIAAAMQADLLPLPKLPVESGSRIVVQRRSARIVAGDYVDVCPTPNGGLLLAMVDVMGKGMPAALFAGMARTAVHIHADIGRPLEHMAHDLNRVLCRQTEGITLFATCALAWLNPARNLVRIINAGHCPVIWQGTGKGGTMREFAPSGPPMGLYPEAKYHVEEQAVYAGDRIVMVTDGLYEWETRGGGNDHWARLVEIVRTRSHEGGDALWQTFQERIHAAMPGATEPRDDQTMLFWEKIAP